MLITDSFSTLRVEMPGRLLIFWSGTHKACWLAILSLSSAASSILLYPQCLSACVSTGTRPQGTARKAGIGKSLYRQEIDSIQRWHVSTVSISIQVLYLSMVLRYLYFIWLFSFYATLEFYFRTATVTS